MPLKINPQHITQLTNLLVKLASTSKPKASAGNINLWHEAPDKLYELHVMTELAWLVQPDRRKWLILDCAGNPTSTFLFRVKSSKLGCLNGGLGPCSIQFESPNNSGALYEWHNGVRWRGVNVPGLESDISLVKTEDINDRNPPRAVSIPILASFECKYYSGSLPLHFASHARSIYLEHTPALMALTTNVHHQKNFASLMRAHAPQVSYQTNVDDIWGVSFQDFAINTAIDILASI
jgi:hypothetical protein